MKTIEAFTAERRERLTVADDALRSTVAEALLQLGASGWSDPIVEAASQIWLENYLAEAPDALYRAGQARFETQLARVLERTTDTGGSEAQVNRITHWLSTYAVNAGTVQGAYRRGVRHKMWLDMGDSHVRPAHARADGQVVPMGSAFTIDGAKLAYPGEPVGPPELWIECRCVIMPAAASGETMSANTFDLGPDDDEDPGVILSENAFTAMQETPGPDEDMPEPEQRTGALIVLLPAESDPVTAATSEDQAHMTTIWFGDVNELGADAEEVEQAVRLYAQDLDGPVVVPVRERGTLGDEDADVVFLEPTDSLLALRDGLLVNEPIRQAHDAAEQYPEWTPHVTLGYPAGVENGPAVAEYDGDEITFDRLGLWLGGEYTEYPMGGTVTASATVSEPAEEIVVDDEFEDGEEEITEIPVHGVLAPEGVPTGDGRGFRVGALSARPITPTRGLPLRLEIVGSHGGNQTSEVVTVGRIDEVFRDEATNMMRFRGAIILTKPHAQAAIEGIIDGSGTGVSIDADAMAVDMDAFSDEAIAEAQAAGREPVTWYSEARIAGLTIVPIGAFHEAYFALGHDFAEDMTPEDVEAAEAALTACGCNQVEIVDLTEDPEANARAEGEALAMGGVVAGDTVVMVGDGGPEAVVPLSAAGDEFAPGTKDGPGWITHPVPTSRIRRYWVRGEGARKINWGAGGDFNRCRALLAKYVQNPDWLAGLCANMHKEALGIWPGEHDGSHRAALMASGAVPAPFMTLVADASAPDVYPSEWFANPNFDQPTNLTIDRESGRIYGHLAYWNSCHIGIAGTCVKPPNSSSSYAGFLKGVVDTDAGEQPVGCLTYGIGHANPNLRAAAATAHYDRPDAVVAYVNIGEDAHGIWYAGVIRPGVSDARIKEFRAVGAISGDWRHVGRYGLELVAAVAVNTPGLPVSIAASGGVQDTLIISTPQFAEPMPDAFTDSEENERFLARAVALALESIRNKERMAEVRARAYALRQADLRARANKEG